MWRADAAGVWRCLSCADRAARHMESARMPPARFAPVWTPKPWSMIKVLALIAIAAVVCTMKQYGDQGKDRAPEIDVARKPAADFVNSSRDATTTGIEDAAGHAVYSMCSSIWPPLPLIRSTLSVFGQVNVDVRFAQLFDVEGGRFEVILDSNQRPSKVVARNNDSASSCRLTPGETYNLR